MTEAAPRDLHACLVFDLGEVAVKTLRTDQFKMG